MSKCDDCSNYMYDEESGCYVCLVNLDEDEMYKFITGNNSGCPYYSSSDDYFLSRKQ